MRDRSFPVPPEVTSRIAQHLESHLDEYSIHQGAPSDNDEEEHDIPEWFDDW